MEIELLGRFVVRRDGHELDSREFGGRLVRRLVRILAAERGRPVTRDALVDALWGDRPPTDPDANLNVLVNRARRALGSPPVIDTVTGGYLLRGGPDVVVDGEAFEEAVRRARDALQDGRTVAALEAVEEALDRWSGPPLVEDAYDDWARAYRDRLDERHQEALEVGAAAALATGAAARAVELAADAVARRPFREAAHVLRMRALAAVGDQAAALAAFDGFRRTLADELGIEPSAEAAALHRRILGGAAAVGGAGHTGPSRPAESSVERTVPPFVGRDRELSLLAGLGGDRHVALLVGRSGSGKSRLLAELVRRADRPVLAARAVLPEREAPWSLAGTLLRRAVAAGVDVAAALPRRSAAAVAELLPDGPPSGLDPGTWRALALQGAAGVLTAAGRALVVVDDLQWADSSSLDVLLRVVGRGDGPAIVLAYRPEEVGEGSPAAGFVAQLRASSRPAELSLGRLGADALGDLVDDPGLVATITEHSDGTPLAVLEVLRELAAVGVVRRDDGEGRWRAATADARDRARLACRAGQQRAVWTRARQQPATAFELLALLALLGRPAPARLLATASGGAEDDVLAGLDQLGRAALVRHGPGGFSTSHDLTAETVRERLGPVDRARLHQLLARALEASGAPPDELARHLAGAGDRAAAAAAFVAAAEERLDRFADREAEQLAGDGLALEPAGEQREALLRVRAETRARRGDLAAARADLRAALTEARSGPVRSRLLSRLAALASGAEDLVHAATLVEVALAEAGDDPAARARALYVGALVDMNLEQGGRAADRFAAAQALFARVADARGVADILDARAMGGFLDGDVTGAVDAFDRVAALFSDAGNLLRVVTPRSTRGHALLFAGRTGDALADVEEALELARALGYAEGEAMVRWHLSEVLAAAGRVAEAAVVAEAAWTIADRVGHRGWTATAWLARGVAAEAGGDLDGADAAFRRALATSDHLPLFACWAGARLARVLAARGALDEARGHADRALDAGPPLGRYEARLVRCELAVERDEPDARQQVEEAAALARAGGHRVSVERLAALDAAVG